MRDPRVYDADHQYERIRRMVQFIRGLDDVLAPLAPQALPANSPRMPGRKKGSGADTLVCHLRDAVALYDYEQVLTVLKASTNPRIAVKDWGAPKPEEPMRGVEATRRGVQLL